jgi:hypothetical protein
LFDLDTKEDIIENLKACEKKDLVVASSDAFAVIYSISPKGELAELTRFQSDFAAREPSIVDNPSWFISQPIV